VYGCIILHIYITFLHFLNVRWQFKFKTDGTELPATGARNRSLCFINNVRLHPLLGSVRNNAFPSLRFRVLIHICINYNNDIKHRPDEERILPHVGLQKYSKICMLFVFTQTEKPTDIFENANRVCHNRLL